MHKKKPRYFRGFPCLWLLLSLLVCCVLVTPLAIFFELDLAGDELPILARPIVDAVALRAREFDELVLRHEAALYRKGL